MISEVFLQINGTDGIGNLVCSYYKGWLKTVNNESALIPALNIYDKPNPTLKFNTKDCEISFTEIGTLVQDHIKHIDFIFSEDEYGTIAECYNKKTREKNAIVTS